MVSINVWEIDNTGVPPGFRPATNAFSAARGEPKPTHTRQVLGLERFANRPLCSDTEIDMWHLLPQYCLQIWQL
jgi:hypothetical protein